MTGIGGEEAAVIINAVDVVPTGAIILWWGSAAAIPSGYVICDGTHGTPDLRDVFVIGGEHIGSAAHPTTNITGSPTTTGGNPTTLSSLNFTPDNVASGSDYSVVDSGLVFVPNPLAAGGSLPPYYALAYIMKL